MKILIDLRCLNYTHITGVNSYTLHLLMCLWQIQKNHPNSKLYSVGIKKHRLELLKKNYSFLDGLFDQNISIAQYLNIKPNIKIPDKLLELYMILFYQKNLDCQNIMEFDYVILPQARILPLHSNSKLITIIHDLYFLIDKSGSYLQRIIYSKSNINTITLRSIIVIASSYSTANDICKIFPSIKQKINLVYPALPIIDTLQVPNQQKNPETINNNYQISSKYYLAISGIEPRKNWKNILLAHHHLNLHKKNNYELVLCGKIVDQKYYKSLIELIHAQKIQNVIWIIDATESQKRSIIEKCEFLLYPSFYEGFGFPLLESHFFGKIVLTSKTSSMPEVTKSGGIFCNPMNFRSISDAIFILQNDQLYFEKLVFEIIRNKQVFEWNELYSFMEQIIQP